MRLLIIEDEENVASFLKKGLKSALFSVDVAMTGKEGARRAIDSNYDLVVLDYHLPDINGEEVAKRIKESKKDLAMIMLSRETKTNVKTAMLSACDDYVVKPFSLDELVSRIRAVKRRGATKTVNEVLSFDGIEMNLGSFVVTCGKKVTPLSHKEFMLLQCLMENNGRALSRGMILEKVWDMDTDPFTNTVDVHIQRLRKKLGTCGKDFVVTVLGVGYKFDGAVLKKK